MNEKTRSSSFKFTLQIAALLVVLLVLAAWAMHRTQVLLNHTLEKTVARQAADLSLLAEERFRQEFESLALAAELLAASPNKIEEERIFSGLRGSEKNVSVGILSVQGEALSGSYISRRSFLGLPHAFRGQNVVDYSSRDGLLFAVPIRHGQNIRAVLYRRYGDTMLPDRFRLTAYHPGIHLLLYSNTGHLVLPYKNYSEEEKAFFSDPAVEKTLATLRKQLVTHRAAATAVEVDGQTRFLFISNLPETNCAVVGYIPWSVVAGDIAKVYERLLRSIGLLLLIFLAAGAYLFRVRRKAEESDALRREKELADNANQAKGAFLANMSHEIRTPINAVLGMNEMILREGTDPAIARYARNIRSAGRTLLDLINDVLDFSKIESGKIELVESDYRLSDLLRNAVNMAKPRAEGKGLTFGLEVDETLPDALFGDMTRVQQIVVNLLTNAAKYTEKGSVDFRVSGEKNEEEQTVFLRFVVQDTGIGIRAEDKDRIFNNFERLDTVRNRSIEGTGLGLAITKRLAKLMGGDVVFESTYGVGSTFTATLLQKIDGDELVGDFAGRLSETETEPAYRAAFRAPDARILVVDDNEINLLVVAGLLKKTEVQIETVSDGQAVLDRLAENRYDAVLLDHRMPGMDGVETLHAAREMPNAKDTPFLILTADAVTGMREKFLKEGFDDYLAKPLDGEKLEWTLMRYLPAEKLHAPDAPLPEGNAALERHAAPPAVPETAGDELPSFDRELGLKYSGGQEDFYRELAAAFAKIHPEKREQLAAAFASESWGDYTDCVHALKSTSLAIGGCRLSAAARDIEMTARVLLSKEATDEEKAQSLAKIRGFHESLLALYDELADAARTLAAESR